MAIVVGGRGLQGCDVAARNRHGKVGDIPVVLLGIAAQGKWLLQACERDQPRGDVSGDPTDPRSDRQIRRAVWS